MLNFGDRLRSLRQSKDLSQSEFAKQIRISKSAVNMYERGEREPNFETLEKIADYFNVDLDYLLGKTDCKNRNHIVLPVKDETPPSLNDKQQQGDRNILRIAGRDGSYQEHILTDGQLAAIKAILDQLPDADDL